jgi:hypothetical protein
MAVGYRPLAAAPRPRPLAKPRASFERPFARASKAYADEAAELVAQLREREPTAHLVDPLLARSRAQTKTTGRQRLTTLQRTLDQMGLKRSKNQREYALATSGAHSLTRRRFHCEMTKSIIRQIFREDLPDNLDALFDEFGTDEFESQLMIVTPRRWGKTTSVAMFCVAAAAAIENLEQAIFSTGRRASQKLLELIYHLLCRVPGMKESIVKKNV